MLSTCEDYGVANVPQSVLWAVDTQRRSFFRRHAIVGKTMCCMAYVVGQSSLSSIAELRNLLDVIILYMAIEEDVPLQTRSGSHQPQASSSQRWRSVCRFEGW